MDQFNMTYTVNLKVENDKLKEKNKKLRDAFKAIDNIISLVPGLRSTTTQKIKDMANEALKDSE